MPKYPYAEMSGSEIRPSLSFVFQFYLTFQITLILPHNTYPNYSQYIVLCQFTAENDPLSVLKQVFEQRLTEIGVVPDDVNLEMDCEGINAFEQEEVPPDLLKGNEKYQVLKPVVTGDVIGLQKALISLISAIKMPSLYPEFQSRFDQSSLKGGNLLQIVY